MNASFVKTSTIPSYLCNSRWMKLFITGGTGFVGSYLVRQLIENKHEISLLVRNRKTIGRLPAGVRVIEGDILDKSSYIDSLASFDAVINLVGIIREFSSKAVTFQKLHFDATRELAEAAVKAGIDRWIQMSANGVDQKPVSMYQTTKLEAEKFLRESGLRLTIFRPSLIFGEPPDGKTEFCTDIFRILKFPFPFVPVFGDGLYRFQPIHATDVARAFAAALEEPSKTEGKTFHLGGERLLTYRELLDAICDGSGIRRKIKIAVPYRPLMPLIKILESFPFFPVTSDQISMLMQGSITPEDFRWEDFGIDRLKFIPDNLSYLR